MTKNVEAFPMRGKHAIILMESGYEFASIHEMILDRAERVACMHITRKLAKLSNGKLGAAPTDELAKLVLANTNDDNWGHNTDGPDVYEGMMRIAEHPILRTYYLQFYGPLVHRYSRLFARWYGVAWKAKGLVWSHYP